MDKISHHPNNKPEVCIPIGKYLIFHEGKLYNYPDDHQWIAQTLLTSLRTEKDQILNEHTIFNFRQIMEVVSLGGHDNETTTRRALLTRQVIDESFMLSYPGLVNNCVIIVVYLRVQHEETGLLC